MTQPRLHMSEADVAPASSIISGATVHVSTCSQTQTVRRQTPVWTANNGHVTQHIGGHTKVSKLDSPVLCREYVRSLDVSVNDPLIV